jgi:hypothetical protein
MAYQGRGSKTGAKIVAKSVKAQGGKAAAAKGAVKSAAKAAVFIYNPNKIGKAAKAAKAVREATKNEARVIAAKRAAATPAAKRTEAEKLAMKRVVPTKSGGLKVRPESKTDVKKLVKESKKSAKPAARKERDYEKIRTTQYNPRTGKKEEIVAGDSKVSQARMAEFKRQGFGQSGNVVRKFKKK